MPKRVWILGAGFSRSLGAPLLNDLLSFRLRSRIYGSHVLKVSSREGADDLPHQDLVYALYHFGRNYPEGYAFRLDDSQPRGETRWSDAEEYLEFLDACEQAGGDGQIELELIRERLAEGSRENSAAFKVATKGSFVQEGLKAPTFRADKLASAARQIIAAEVCLFVRHASPERLRPYQRWLSTLNGDDTIITFNYDVLLESLQTKTPNAKVVVAGAEDDLPMDEQASNAATESTPLLLKLHGSVDWTGRRSHARGSIPFQRTDNPEYATQFPGFSQICTPGTSKLTTTEGKLAPLWDLAAERIKGAGEVFFVGYRIPESDAKAREMLLNGLHRSPTPEEARTLAVHGRFGVPVTIVLGAAPHHDRARLRSLLEMVGADTWDVGLWAQDFLASWQPGRNYRRS